MQKPKSKTKQPNVKADADEDWKSSGVSHRSKTEKPPLWTLLAGRMALVSASEKQRCWRFDKDVALMLVDEWIAFGATLVSLWPKDYPLLGNAYEPAIYIVHTSWWPQLNEWKELQTLLKCAGKVNADLTLSHFFPPARPHEGWKAIPSDVWSHSPFGLKALALLRTHGGSWRNRRRKVAELAVYMRIMIESIEPIEPAPPLSFLGNQLLCLLLDEAAARQTAAVMPLLKDLPRRVLVKSETKESVAFDRELLLRDCKPLREKADKLDELEVKASTAVLEAISATHKFDVQVPYALLLDWAEAVEAMGSSQVSYAVMGLDWALHLNQFTAAEALRVEALVQRPAYVSVARKFYEWIRRTATEHRLKDFSESTLQCLVKTVTRPNLRFQESEVPEGQSALVLDGLEES